VNLNKSAVDGAFRGDVAITGFVELDANEQILAASGNEVLVNDGVLMLNSFSETVQDLKLQAGGEIRGTGTLTVLGVVTSFAGDINTPLNLAGTRVFDVQGTLAVTKTVSNGSVVKNGPGALHLRYVPNTYAGGTFINAGTVVATDAGLGDPAGAIHFNGGLLGADGVNFTTTSRTMTWGPNGGGFDISNVAGVFTVSTQTLSGPGPLTKRGAGKLVLATPQSYTGGTTVSAGTLEGNSATLQGNIFNNATLAFNQAVDGAYAGNLSGAGTLNKTGAGALQLSGDNTNAGPTNVTAGRLSLNGGNALGDQSAVNLANAAGVALELVGASETIGSLSGGGAAGGNVELGGGTLTTGANNSSAAFAGVIGGAGAVVKTGAGAWTLAGDNTYSGGTTFAGGVVIAASDANLGDPSGALRFNGGALRPTGAFDATSREIELQSGGGGLDIANTANLFTYAGDISGAGSLTKLGGGKLVLAGSNSYAGGTTVTAGTLEGDSESLQGNILNNALLVFNQATDGAYGGSLSGVGQLLKLGGGTATFPGASAGGGPITINEGALAVAAG
jgi:autotransporter-associated beta strand protein